MASKASPFSRSEIQEAIKTQGEIIRQLKLEEQTDEVKKKVKSYCFSFQPISLTLKNFQNVPVIVWVRYHVASMKLLITRANKAPSTLHRNKLKTAFSL